MVFIAHRLYSHGAKNLVLIVVFNFWTTKRLNFRTVKVLPIERNTERVPCKRSLFFLKAGKLIFSSAKSKDVHPGHTDSQSEHRIFAIWKHI